MKVWMSIKVKGIVWWVTAEWAGTGMTVVWFMSWQSTRVDRQSMGTKDRLVSSVLTLPPSLKVFILDVFFSFFGPLIGSTSLLPLLPLLWKCVVRSVRIEEARTKEQLVWVWLLSLSPTSLLIVYSSLGSLCLSFLIHPKEIILPNGSTAERCQTWNNICKTFRTSIGTQFASDVCLVIVMEWMSETLEKRVMNRPAEYGSFPIYSKPKCVKIEKKSLKFGILLLLYIQGGKSSSFQDFAWLLQKENIFIVWSWLGTHVNHTPLSSTPSRPQSISLSSPTFCS